MLCSADTAVMVVDMQEIERPHFEEAEWAALTSAINRLVSRAREVRMEIIHVFYMRRVVPNLKRYREWEKPFFETYLDETYCKKCKIVSECFPQDEDWLYRKNDFGAFRNGDFLKQEPIFRHKKNLIVSGVQADDCVQATVFGALDHSYDVFVPPESTATYGEPGDFQRSIKNMRKRGAIALPLEDVLEKMCA